MKVAKRRMTNGVLETMLEDAGAELTFAESEGSDCYRVDMSGDYSVWFRKSPTGDCLEGCVPQFMKAHIEKVVKNFNVTSYMEYI